MITAFRIFEVDTFVNIDARHKFPLYPCELDYYVTTTNLPEVIGFKALITEIDKFASKKSIPTNLHLAIVKDVLIGSFEI